MPARLRHALRGPSPVSKSDSKHKKSRQTRTLSIIFLLINTLVWGAALPAVKPSLSFTDPFSFLLYRYIFAAILTLPILIYYLWKHRQLWKTIPIITGLEVIGTTLALGLLYTGLERTTALEASVIVTTTPLFTTLAGIWFLHEKQERREWLGLFIALTATVVLSLEPVFSGRVGYFSPSLLGNMLVLLQNICTAAYFVLAKKYYSGVPKLFVSIISFYVGIITFAPMSLWQTGLPVTEFLPHMFQDLATPSVLFAVLYMAIFGSIIGLTAYIQGQEGIEASEASLFTYLQPLVYIPLSLIILHEPAPRLLWVCLIFIVIGVGIAEWRTRWRAR